MAKKSHRKHQQQPEQAQAAQAEQQPYKIPRIHIGSYWYEASNAGGVLWMVRRFESADGTTDYTETLVPVEGAINQDNPAHRQKAVDAANIRNSWA